MEAQIYKINLTKLAKFNLKSFLGRLTRRDKPNLSREYNYLNLGCGSNPVDGMINADFFSGFRFWRAQRQLEWTLDLRYPLNCPDSIFDGVFTEHVLEHLYPDEALNLLKGLYRVMKEGAVIRLTVPDLEKYINYYNGEIKDPELSLFQERFPTGTAAIRNLSQNYFHFSLWDFEELKRYMEQAGFQDVERKQFNDCSNAKLCLDLPSRAWETLYVEARKMPIT